MVNVTFRTPAAGAFLDDVKAWPTEKSLVHNPGVGDIMGTDGLWFGRFDIGLVPYFVGPLPHYVALMSVEAFEALLEHVNPGDIMVPGGTKILGATGLPDSPEYPDGKWGSPPDPPQMSFG